MSSDDNVRFPGRRSRTELWSGSVGSFGLDEVDLPNGAVAELALLQHPGAAAIVAFVDEHTVLLLRQFRYAVGGTIWEIPAGKLDHPGEDPAACALRELEEETGYRAARIEATGRIWTTPGFTDEIIWLFEAHELVSGPLRHGVHEVIDVHEVPLARALEMIDRGEIQDAKSIAALFHAARRSRAL